MKSSMLSRILLIGLSVFILISCGDPGTRKKGVTPDGKVASVEVEVFDPVKIKDQIIEVIQKAPKGEDLVNMLNEAGASYIFDLTLPVENAEKMMTATAKSLGQGFYAFDFKYASVYNRSDVALQIKDIIHKIQDDLGLSSELSTVKKFTDRMAGNRDNKDSLNYLTTEALNEYHRQMAISDKVGAYALSVIGANIEALHVLCQMALLSRDNTKFLQLLSNQHERVKSLNQLLELMSGDETVQPYYDQMKPVFEFFENNPVIKNEHVNQIAPVIETVRKNIVE